MDNHEGLRVAFNFDAIVENLPVFIMIWQMFERTWEEKG